MADVSSAELKCQVKSFWNDQCCGTTCTVAEKFTWEYFEQIEQWRYTDQPFIHSFAQFSRYHGKRVLEVGFGAGTDFIQWLRAGARATGVDLTEEALAHLTHRVKVYQLPLPEDLRVADAENLPFASGSFDLGYSWGVLHHSPDTPRAIAELVRVVRPGGEIKIMLYNRRCLAVFKLWVKHALLARQPWKNFHWVMWHRLESIGTKGYTKTEVMRMLEPLGLTDIRMQTFAPSADRIVRRDFPFPLFDAALKLALDLSGQRLGWFRGISARKL